MKVWSLSERSRLTNHENIRFTEGAKEAGVELTILSPDDLEVIVSDDGRRSIHRDGEGIQRPDCFIPRVSDANSSYVTFAIVRQFERLGVLVLNRSEAIALSKDKLATLQILGSHGIPVPKTMLVKLPVPIEAIEAQFDYPLVLKTVYGAMGKGVFLCESRGQLQDYMDFMDIHASSGVNVMIQKFISSSRGKDIRVIVVGGRAMGGMLRLASDGQFKANFSTGGQVEQLALSSEFEWLAVETARLLDLHMCGVDILFEEHGYSVCEVNSAFGFQGFERATGVDIPLQIFDYLKLRLGLKKTSPTK